VGRELARVQEKVSQSGGLIFLGEVGEGDSVVGGSGVVGETVTSDAGEVVKSEPSLLR
jgi:hypothetical protein